MADPLDYRPPTQPRRKRGRVLIVACLLAIALVALFFLLDVFIGPQ